MAKTKNHFSGFATGNALDFNTPLLMPVFPKHINSHALFGGHNLIFISRTHNAGLWFLVSFPQKQDLHSWQRPFYHWMVLAMLGVISLGSCLLLQKSWKYHMLFAQTGVGSCRRKYVERLLEVDGNLFCFGKGGSALYIPYATGSWIVRQCSITSWHIQGSILIRTTR